MKTLNLCLVSFILALTFVSPQGSGFVQGGDGRTQSTALYRITLDIGPVPAMPRPEQAARAPEEGVPFAMLGMSMPLLAMADPGRPANRHVEVAVYDKATGAPQKSPVPKITITDRKTGRSKALQAVTAMHDVTEGQGDPRFGDNVYLADGMYRITVSVGGERAVFKKVAVGRP